MKAQILALLAISVCATATAQTLVACGCEIVNTVCLTDVEMSEHAVHVEMEPDRMGNHSNYRGVAVFQIGFDEKGHLTGASAISGSVLNLGHYPISGHPLGISHLL